MHRLHPAVTMGLLLSLPLAPARAQSRRSTHTAAARPAATSPLKPYSSCHFDDGLTLVETLPLPPDVAGRTVETMHGPARIPILRGDRVFFGYPGTDPFASVTAEQLPADSYDASKQSLISNFEQILSSDDGTRNYALKPTLNGFEIYGLDRPRLEPGALGVYLLIDNLRGIVATVHFLNAEPDSRKFATIEDYRPLRDHFLATYTACIHSPTASTAPRATARTAPSHHGR